MVEENKIDRKVIHTKDIKFDVYMRVLLFLIENKDKSFTNKDIRESIYGDSEEYRKTSFRNMFNRCIDFYVGSGIFLKTTPLIDNNNNEIEVIIDKEDYDCDDKHYNVEFEGRIVKVNPQTIKIRLYDNEKDRVTKIDKNGNEVDDEYYTLDLHMPSTYEGREMFCETVSSMITHIPNINIYTPTLKTVLESQTFGFQTDFVSQTISKTILKHHNINIERTDSDINGYPLDVIISIIKSQINVNVKFENFGNTIELKNIKIKKVSIKENGFDIHFDNFISQNQSNINQILSIENVSEDGLRDDIDKVVELTNDIEDESIKKLIKEIIDFKNSLEMFIF